MMRTVPALVLFALAVSCSKKPEDVPAAKALKPVVLRVDGMQRGEGGKT